MKKFVQNLLLIIILSVIGVYFLSGSEKIHYPQPQYNTPSHPVGYIPQPFDVISYDADIDFTSAPNRDMKGLCRIKALITGQNDTSDFIFHLMGLKVDSVFYYNTKVEFTEVGIPDSATYHFKISLNTTEIPAENIISKDTADIIIYYSGKMTPEMYLGKTGWGGVQSSGGILYAMGVGFKNNYISTTRHWLPCYDHPSDKAVFSGRFRVPKGKVCASVGLPTGVKTINDTVEEYEWKQTYPAATYLYAFAVADYKLIKYEAEGLPYYLYTLAKDSANTARNFKLLPQMVKAFEKRFGKYPFEKVGYANTPTGSMEHQTLVSYDVSLLNVPDTLNSVAAHELAHQWFGDHVSCYDFRDAWLSEGFATYCEAIWEEELYGFTDYLDVLTSKINGYFNFSKQEGVFSLYDYSRINNSSNYPITIYYKGAVVIGMLRYMLGDEKFFGGIKSYTNKYGYGNATTELLKAELEQVSVIELDTFFNQWIYRKGWPIIKVGLTQNLKPGNVADVTIDIEQTQDEDYGIYSGFPVEFGFKQKGGNTYYHTVIVDSVKQSFMVNDIPDITNGFTINAGPSVRPLVQVVSSNLKITGVDDYLSDENVDVFPNPAEGFLKIQAGNNPGHYTIIDLVGNALSTGNLEPGLNTLDLGASGLRIGSGIYYITINSNGINKTHKFSVIK